MRKLVLFFIVFFVREGDGVRANALDIAVSEFESAHSEYCDCEKMKKDKITENDTEIKNKNEDLDEVKTNSEKTILALDAKIEETRKTKEELNSA